MAGARVNLADALELVLAVALLVYLAYALIRPERF
jgi:K+-transporting ATPase KdpF subunit